MSKNKLSTIIRDIAKKIITNFLAIYNTILAFFRDFSDWDSKKTTAFCVSTPFILEYNGMSLFVVVMPCHVIWFFHSHWILFGKH